jgi:hypothetical protein
MTRDAVRDFDVEKFVGAPMTKYGQPMISRETRLLLITIAISIAALWLLARIRFQERPISVSAVPPVLAQLRSSSGFSDLARAIADIRPGVTAALTAVERSAPALLIREDAAVTLARVPPDARLRFDRATGLTIVKSPPSDLPGLLPWVPRLLDYPRYLVAADFAGSHLALRPIFVGGLFPVASALWSGEIWTVPPGATIDPGTFVFTTEGALAGLAVDHGGRAAIVPATLLLKIANDLLAQERLEPGELGVAVQPLSPAVRSASGASFGVIVTSVESDGPAAGRLIPTEVIEAVDEREILTLEQWHASVARLSAGQSRTLRVRGNGEVRNVPITATAPVPPPREKESASEIPIGMSMRAVRAIGTAVVSVQPRSAAARATIRPGDIITVAGGQTAPTPLQVARAFNALGEGGALLLAISHDAEHRVVALEKIRH